MGNGDCGKAATLDKGGEALVAYPAIVRPCDAATGAGPLRDDEGRGQTSGTQSQVTPYDIRVTPALTAAVPGQKPLEDPRAAAELQLSGGPNVGILQSGSQIVERVAQRVQCFVIGTLNAANTRHDGDRRLFENRDITRLAARHLWDDSTPSRALAWKIFRTYYAV